MENIGRLWIGIILIAVFLSVSMHLEMFLSEATADSYRHGEKKHVYTTLSKSKPHKDDEGNELTGQSAAWVFAAANLSVVLSLIIKAIIGSIGMAEDLRDKLKKFNRTQKKYLMPFHYILNPLALILAFTHFSLSYCRSSSLPEWGLAGMVLLVITGGLIKFRLVSPNAIRIIYRIHTNPLLISLLITMLLIGHNIVH